MEILFAFPLDLLWGVAAAYFYKPIINIRYLWMGLAALFVYSVFINDTLAFYFWAPGGMASVMLGTLLLLQYATMKTEGGELFKERIPNRGQLKEILMKTDDHEERQIIYVRLIKELSSRILSKNDKSVEFHTKFFLLVIGSIMIVNFAVLAYFYFEVSAFQNLIHKGLNEFIETMNKTLKIAQTPEEKKLLLKLAIDYSPISFFAVTCIVQLILKAYVNRTLDRQNTSILQPGNFLFFRLSENFIWFFLAVAAAFLVGINFEIHRLFRQIITNIFAITSILYVLNGMGIITAYCRIRFLPIRIIIVASVTLIIINRALFMIFCLFFFLLGILDFRFNLRKRALQPKIILNS